MPWSFVCVGLLLCILAVKPDNSLHDFASTAYNDLSGETGFLKWLAAIVIIGAIGYLPDMQGVSTAFLILCLIAFVVSNNGVFAKAQEALT